MTTLSTPPSCRAARKPRRPSFRAREQGYDFLALTDHNRYYPGDEIDVAFDGVVNHQI